MHILHECDNPRCVNPLHLFEGTDKDNSDDKVKKGRQAKWKKHGMLISKAKLAKKIIHS